MTKNQRSNDPKNLPRVKTRLGADTVLTGTLKFSESVEIAGRLKGNVIAEGFLYVREGADIEADIRAREIIVGGTVHGNIEALDRLEILQTGRIYGNVKTARFRVADGVVFEGKCEMVRDSQDVDVFAATAEHVRESVQRG